MEGRRTEFMHQGSQPRQDAVEPESKKVPEMGSMKEFLLQLQNLVPDLADHKLEQFRKAKPLFKTLELSKRIHSRNVALQVAEILQEVDVILGALLHDVKERAPKAFRKQKRGVHRDVVDLVEALTEDALDDGEDVENAPLAHLKAVFPTLSSTIKNRLIVIKLADRLDNLQKRSEADLLSKNYRHKSKKLFKFLSVQFTGELDMDEEKFHQLTNAIASNLKCRNFFEEEERQAVAA